MRGSLFEQYFKTRPEFLDLDLGLSRINAAAKDAVDVIHTKVIHIAGTNGKGSTSLFIAHLLQRQGFSTLLFTSPHINSIRERIQLNLEPVSAEQFDMLFLSAKSSIEKHKLSYFESIYLMALILCKQAVPDYLILETGLGGRYDATNSAITSLKTPVLTSLSQDHKEYLGRRIADIVGEKAAIAGGNSPVFIGCNPDFILTLLRQMLPDNELRSVDLSRLSEAQVLYPDPYSCNYLNAHQVVEYLTGRALPFEKLPLPPCRQEEFGRVMLDGAHNASGILSLLRSLENNLPDVVIVSMTAERDIRKLCCLIERKIPNLLTTLIPDNPRSISMETLKRLPYKSFEDPFQALAYAREHFSGRILVAGSLYLCAAIRRRLVS